MFIVSLKKLKLPGKRAVKALAVGGVAALAVIVAAVALQLNRVPEETFAEGIGTYSLEAESEREREEFFHQLGYEAEAVYEEAVVVPQKGHAFEEYNLSQMDIGLDLRPFGGRAAQQYTLRLTPSKGEPYERDLYGVIIVYKGRVIALHITDPLSGEIIPVREAVPTSLGQ